MTNFRGPKGANLRVEAKFRVLEGLNSGLEGYRRPWEGYLTPIIGLCGLWRAPEGAWGVTRGPGEVVSH